MEAFGRGVASRSSTYDAFPTSYILSPAATGWLVEPEAHAFVASPIIAQVVRPYDSMRRLPKSRWACPCLL